MAKQDTTRTIKLCPKLEGEIALPGDKSISHRAVILNSLVEVKPKSAILPQAEIVWLQSGVYEL